MWWPIVLRILSENPYRRGHIHCQIFLSGILGVSMHVQDGIIPLPKDFIRNYASELCDEERSPVFFLGIMVRFLVFHGFVSDEAEKVTEERVQTPYARMRTFFVVACHISHNSSDAPALAQDV